MNSELNLTIRPFVIWESQISNCFCVQRNTGPASSKSCIEVACPISDNYSVITSRRNDVSQFSNRITCGHCSILSLPISFRSRFLHPQIHCSKDLRATATFNSRSFSPTVSFSGKGLLHLRYAKGFHLREGAVADLGLLPMPRARSHRLEMVSIRWFLCRIKILKESLGIQHILIRFQSCASLHRSLFFFSSLFT